MKQKLSCTEAIAVVTLMSNISYDDMVLLLVWLDANPRYPLPKDRDLNTELAKIILEYYIEESKPTTHGLSCVGITKASARLWLLTVIANKEQQRNILSWIMSQN